MKSKGSLNLYCYQYKDVLKVSVFLGSLLDLYLQRARKTDRLLCGISFIVISQKELLICVRFDVMAKEQLT